jgi:hypothetical protein
LASARADRYLTAARMCSNELFAGPRTEDGEHDATDRAVRAVHMDVVGVQPRGETGARARAVRANGQSWRGQREEVLVVARWTRA